MRVIFWILILRTATLLHYPGKSFSGVPLKNWLRIGQNASCKLKFSDLPLVDPTHWH